MLIGFAIYLVYDLQNDDYVNDANRIVISKADIDRLNAILTKKRQRPPTQIELDGLIEQQIREQVMYREALAMGMDQNDAIVRKRLAQKVEFISSDIAATIEPTDDDLADYLKAHPEKFETAAFLSFEQIYFNRDKRGTQTRDDALRTLTELNENDPKTEISNTGDSFMMGLNHDDITEYGVSRLFGKSFAAELFKLDTGGWQGPIESSYGLHLVRITNKKDTQKAELNSVRNKVHSEWLSEQRRTMNEIFYQNLRQRYEIVIEKSIEKNNLVSSK
jgi:peptidyl-prolyl cis-trans isomerase C